MNRKAMKALAKERLQAAGKTPLLVTLVFLLCLAALTALSNASVLLERIQPSGGGYLSSRVSLISFLGTFSFVISLVMTVISILLQSGYAFAMLKVLSGDGCEYRDLLHGTRLPIRLVVMTMLKSLFILLWSYLAMLLPSALLVFLRYPGETDPTVVMNDLNTMPAVGIISAFTVFLVVVISYRYRMSLFAMLENPRLAPSQAIRTSVLITKRHRFQLFLLDLSFLPWVLLSVLTLGILLIWKLPYIIVTEAAAYHSLLGEYEYRVKQQLAERFQRAAAATPTPEVLQSPAPIEDNSVDSDTDE